MSPDGHLMAKVSPTTRDIHDAQKHLAKKRISGTPLRWPIARTGFSVWEVCLGVSNPIVPIGKISPEDMPGNVTGLYAPVFGDLPIQGRPPKGLSVESHPQGFVWPAFRLGVAHHHRPER